MRNVSESGQEGFTFVELVIVVAIIGFLAAAVIVAVDPVKRTQDARDSRRLAEVNSVLNAMLAKQVDDRAVFNGLATAPIITHATYGQVIVSSDEGVVCNDSAKAPECPAIALDTAGANRNCVAALGGMMAGVATSSGTAVTGSGTDFDPQAGVGDVLTSASGGTCTVSVVTDDDEITCSNEPSPVFAGTMVNTSKSLSPTYIAEIPVDPRGPGASTGSVQLPLGSNNSGYYIRRTTGNRIEIGSCYPENTTVNPAIRVKR